jgi:hypothetical protein
MNAETQWATCQMGTLRVLGMDGQIAIEATVDELKAAWEGVSIVRC